MNMIDLYLSMNVCERDKQGRIYYNGNGKKEFIGTLKGHAMDNGTLTIEIESSSPVKFLNINVSVNNVPV